MVSVTFPQADINALVKQMERAQVELGKSTKQSLQWAAIEVCGTLAGSCKVAPKKRKVVPNPHPDSNRDARRAKWGVMRFAREPVGAMYFQPIYRTGEFGKIKFLNKKTGEYLTRDRITGKITRNIVETGGGPEQIPGIMQSRKRNIGRSGLAKLMFQRAKGYAIRGGTVNAKGVPDIAGVIWTGLGNFANTTVTIWSKLRYIEEALKGGKQDVSTAMIRAADSLRYKINQQLAKIAAGAK